MSNYRKLCCSNVLSVVQAGSVQLPAEVAGIDDVAVADGFLFAMDGGSPGSLAVYSLK